MLARHRPAWLAVIAIATALAGAVTAIPASAERATPLDLLDGALARVGDRLDLTLIKAPAAILVFAKWSPPSLLERDLLTEIAGGQGNKAGSRVNLLFLDADDPADSSRIKAIGGAPIVPYALLLDCHGIVFQRYLGWPDRNPSSIRKIVTRDMAALVRR